MPDRPGSPGRPRVALLSAAAYAHLDTDLPLLVPALTRLGVDATIADWHDGATDWAAFDLVVIRSPWDYTDRSDDFLSRLEEIAAAARLANPLPVVQGNIDKRYLARLAAAGLPVVPTTLLEPGGAPVIDGDVEVVVKPTVSAGGRDTDRYPPGRRDDARAHAGRLLAGGGAVLVQPYLADVDTTGETGLVFLGDRFSHAFRKGPILRPDGGLVEGLYREEHITPRDPTREELTVADAVLDSVHVVAPGCSRRDLLYARVDLVPGPDGPVLMELELIEPSLFLEFAPDAATARAAEAIAAVARTA